MLIAGNRGTNDYRYEYQGQNSEKDGETGWNNFLLRMYNSRIGRWFQYDPKGQFSSPYIGMGNDPISHVDPDGGKVDGWFDDGKGGDPIYDPNVHSQKDLKINYTYDPAAGKSDN